MRLLRQSDQIRRSEKTKIYVRQGKRKKSYLLKNKAWNRIVVSLKNIERHGTEIILEAEEFWIPAEIFPGSDNRRELSVMVKDAKVMT